MLYLCMEMEEMIRRGPYMLFTLIPLMIGGMLWLLAGVLLFSWLEGKYGATPGKYIFGIRVLGTDLRPCGFFRALIRNILKLIDSFFNFLVGVTTIALTENWQRIGDLAARTIVV